MNLFEAFNVIAIKLVVILNHFPGDKTVFYGIYLTLWLECTLLVSTDSDLSFMGGFASQYFPVELDEGLDRGGGVRGGGSGIF